MPEKTHKNIELRRYLLGRVTHEEERQKIEERLMLEDDYFEELSFEEGELIQDYVDEQLAEDERRDFERHFMISGERRKKIKFAQALRRYVDEQKIPKKVMFAERNKEKDYMGFFKSFFSSPLTAAFGALVIVGFFAFVVWKTTEHSSDDKRILASLNKAHKKERPFESRISGFDYAPANNLRGGTKDAASSVERDLAERLSLEAVQKSKTAENLHALGQVYLAKMEFDKALEQLQAALKLAPRNAGILNDLGVSYLEKSKRLSPGESAKLDYTARALESFENAIESNSKLTEARFNKAICLQELSSIEEARKAWQEYLNFDSDSKWADEARRKLELLETDKSQSKTKEQVLEEFLISYRVKDDDSAWNISSRNREMIKGKLIPQQLAFSFLNPAAAAGEKKEYLSALKYAGDLEKQKRRDPYFSEIADYYANSSAQQQALLKEGQKLMLEGFDLMLQNENRKAYEAFGQAQAAFTKAGDVWEAKLSEYWAAACQYNLANLSEHRKTLEELADFCQKRNYRWFLAEIYIWLGVNAEERTEFSKAIEYHKKAAALCEEISDVYNLEKTLTILADEYATLKQYQSSLGAIQKSLALSAEHPETSLRQKWRTFNGAAEIFYGLKYYSAAIAFEKEALAIGGETKDITFNHTANLNLGIIYGRQQKYKEGIEFLKQSERFARSLIDEGTKNKYLALTYTQLANLKRISGDCAGALGDYDKAVEYSSKEYKSDEYNARKGRLLCYATQRQETALQAEFPAVLAVFEQNRRQIIEEASRNTFFDNEQDVYDLAIDYEYSKGNYEQAFNHSETSRSRSLLDLLKYGAQVSGDESEIKFPEIAEPLKLEEIRRSLPDRVQIVQYSVLNDKVLIWLVTKNDFAVFGSMVSAEELNEKITSYLTLLTDRTFSEEEQRLSKEIYQILISPVAGKLDPAKEISFVPDKFLFRVPFPALSSPQTGKFLVEDFVSFYSPSANVFLLSSTNAAKEPFDNQESILTIGNPAFDQSSFPHLLRLPSAEKEVKNIAGIYSNSTPLIGKEATKEEVKLKFPTAEIVHFAGHYVVDDLSPMRSYLLLAGKGADATLSNYELMKESPSPRAKLIILSACQTGVERYYNGEGMIGAARTFLGMGIPLVIASQWEVDSDATEILMSKFHQYRRQERLSSAVALHRAQVDMLGGQNKDFRKPFYWAAFAPIGGYTQF